MSLSDPTWLRLLQAGLALAGVIVLLAVVQGEIVWAGESGVTFDILLNRMLTLAIPGFILVILSGFVRTIYWKLEERKFSKGLA